MIFLENSRCWGYLGQNIVCLAHKFCIRISLYAGDASLNPLVNTCVDLPSSMRLYRRRNLLAWQAAPMVGLTVIIVTILYHGN
jgi:hypothetical protein